MSDRGHIYHFDNKRLIFVSEVKEISNTWVLESHLFALELEACCLNLIVLMPQIQMHGRFKIVVLFYLLLPGGVLAHHHCYHLNPRCRYWVFHATSLLLT